MTQPIAVEDLKDLAGRYVAHDGEFVHYGERLAHTDAWYWSLHLEIDEDEAVRRIADLPVHLVLQTHDIEHGLVAAPEAGSAQEPWYIALAFCRLGILPPATELHLSDVEVPGVDDGTRRYIIDALLRSWELHLAHSRVTVDGLQALRTSGSATATRLPLITEHWFREGPVQPAGYWICALPQCGRHRADHVQAEGQWLNPPHPFTPQRIAPSRCRVCGRHRLHTTHLPWRWDQYRAPGAASRC